MTITDYRLTTADEWRIVDAIRDTLTRWTRNHWNPAGRSALRADETAIITRIAAHAIGCSTFDLRDVELDYIAARVAELAADAIARANAEQATR